MGKVSVYFCIVNFKQKEKVTKTKRHITWKAFHKWVGLVFTIFLLLFCVSGIVLNHRSAFSGIEINRSWMPSGYTINNYNNGIVKGTLALDSTKVLVYGNAGVWKTDKEFSKFSDYNGGLPEGVDGRSVRNIVRSKDGKLWCAAQFDLYYREGNKWHSAELPGNDERISDVALTRDSLNVVALTRSAAYVSMDSGNDRFERVEIERPSGYEPKVTLFKTIWDLHSGILFGLPGQIVVDVIAIIIAFLSFTGLVVFILPYRMRRVVSVEAKRRLAPKLKWNLRWHNHIGYYTIILTILIAFTGMCLRPPLMIPFVLVKTSPVPGSTLDSDNVWHDKLRGIRWDDAIGKWLVSTSEGFIAVPEKFDGEPVKFEKMPPVSPMGITVFEPTGTGSWLVGSFSGLYEWNPGEETITDHVTGKPYVQGRRGMSMSPSTMVSGFTRDYTGAGEVIIDYSKGSNMLPEMPQVLKDQPMSAWNAALELHVGRCYTPFLGPFSELFVFLSGLILILILVSGLIMRLRHDRNKSQIKIK